MMNYLPNDIIIKILSINEENNFEEHKKKYRNILYHLEDIIELTHTDYYDELEEENIIDEDWGFANAMIECITNENIDNMCDSQLEKDIDEYYNT